MPRFHGINGKRVKFTAEEEVQWDADAKVWADGALDRALLNLRDKRNRILASSDWTGLADTALTNEKSAEWKLYRQKLRDLPKGLNTEFKVKNAVWPTKP